VIIKAQQNSWKGGIPLFEKEGLGEILPGQLIT
jgi:hypothetical protein